MSSVVIDTDKRYPKFECVSSKQCFDFANLICGRESETYISVQLSSVRTRCLLCRGNFDVVSYSNISYFDCLSFITGSLIEMKMIKIIFYNKSLLDLGSQRWYEIIGPDVRGPRDKIEELKKIEGFKKLKTVRFQPKINK